MPASTATTADRQVVITRTFDAPRALVFEAWSKPEHLKHWFGPTGFTLPVCEMDFRAGGVMNVVMRAPDGQEFRSNGRFREIVAPERIVMEGALLGDDGKPQFEDRNTVTFEERSGKTIVTVTAQVIKIHDPRAAAGIEGMEQGWNETLDRLEAYIATKH